MAGRYHQRPENAIAKADEFIKVGKLHDNVRISISTHFIDANHDLGHLSRLQFSACSTLREEY